MLTPDERVALLQEVLAHLDNVEVEAYEGLLVDLARERGAGVIVKGLRALSDVERDIQVAQMNAGLYEGGDTFCVATDPRWSVVSSRGETEAAAHGGDVSGL